MKFQRAVVSLSMGLLVTFSSTSFARISEKQKLAVKLDTYDTVVIKVDTTKAENKEQAKTMEETLVSKLNEEKLFTHVIASKGQAPANALMLNVDMAGKKKTGMAAKLMHMDMHQFQADAELRDKKGNTVLSTFHVTGMVSQKSVGTGSISIGIDNEVAQQKEGMTHACNDIVAYLKKHK